MGSDLGLLLLGSAAEGRLDKVVIYVVIVDYVCDGGLGHRLTRRFLLGRLQRLLLGGLLVAHVQ